MNMRMKTRTIIIQSNDYKKVSLFQSWRNNLVFHGITYDDPQFEEDAQQTEEKIREVIRVDLQISREISISRAQRIKTGPLVRGTHPILGILCM